MTSELAIRAEDLGKRYFLNNNAAVGTLRDRLTQILATPFRRGQSAEIPPTLFWALRHVTFELRHGQILGIIGRNGAGKSTLLKLLTRVMRPTEGELEVWGRVGSLLEVGIGFHPELTGRENVFLSGSIIGMTHNDIVHKFDEIVHFSGIEKFIDTPVKFYSSGMYIRLAFSVSANLDPDILIIDEVLAVGDLDFQKKSQAKIDEIRRRGSTIILASHDIYTVAETSTTVMWLEQGQIQEMGDPKEMVSHYIGAAQAADAQVQSSALRETPAVSPAVATVTFEPPIGTEGIHIYKVYVLDHNSCVPETGAINYEHGFTLCADYVVVAKVEALQIYFKLYNEREQVVLHTQTSDFPNDALTRCGDVGQHHISVEIPGYLLAPAQMDVEFGACSPNFTTHIISKNAFSFSIIHAKIDTLGLEILRPKFQWNVT